MFLSAPLTSKGADRLHLKTKKFTCNLAKTHSVKVNVNQPTDNYLIDRILEGDHTLYETLVQRHQSYAMTIAYKIVNNREDAEEVAQDSFVKAFHKLDTFSRMSKFSTWIYRIVSNTAITYVRKKKLNQFDLDKAKRVPVASKDEMEHSDRKWFIDKALSQMIPEDRMVVALFYLKDMTLEEIADITNYSTNTLKVRLFRARKRLADELKKVLKEEALYL